MRFIRKLLGLVIALGFLFFGLASFFGFYEQSLATGNRDDLYAGIFMGGLLCFCGLLLLVVVLRKPRKPADPAAAAATIWAVGMTSDFDDFDGSD
ncbi:hypothetical protein [Rhodovulum adriaticum]|uniref:Uncharacterized protein n=1 Tax=Rhodovulum adriaticum TaxID=35804 RepID=A0A4R2NWC8_RHOAD|nr:hypothetical protein [Rhodovulum adriaticum]MBK1636414.1 hypothetical protein [Rhodovulum adriaticum]TCP26469.1 hypothetical protein EV656_102438 [Rhodovulum adriaticum]